ncbi:hypothetical protein ACIQLJ_02205 [Microbacterium sp. NPDC091313]
MRRRFSLAALVAATAFLVLAASVGASARWTAPASSLPATARAATISSTLAPGTASALGGEWKYSGSPSSTRTALLTYANTGTAPVAVTLAVNATAAPASFAGHVELALWTPAGTTCDSSAAGWGAGTLAAPPALPPAFGAVAPGATVRLCAATRVSTTVAATQGATLAAALVLTGTVGANWSTAASTAFSQSVFRQAATGVISCASVSGLGPLGLTPGVRLTWAAVPGATGYNVYWENETSPLVTNVPATATPSVDLAPTSLLGTARLTSVSVTALESNVGSESTPTSRAVRVTAISVLGQGLLPGLACS